MAGSETMEVVTTVTETGDSDQPAPEEPERQVQEQTCQPEGQVQTADQTDRLLKLPMSRVKTIIKMDPDVTLASQEAVVTLTKAAVRIFQYSFFLLCFLFYFSLLFFLAQLIDIVSLAPGSVVLRAKKTNRLNINNAFTKKLRCPCFKASL